MKERAGQYCAGQLLVAIVDEVFRVVACLEKSPCHDTAQEDGSITNGGVRLREACREDGEELKGIQKRRVEIR